VTVLLGNGDGSFKSASDYVPFNVSAIGCQIAKGIPTPGAATFGDFNGDGKPDMAIADASNCLVAVFLNNGDGTFTESGTYHAGGYQPSGLIDVIMDGGEPAKSLKNFGFAPCVFPASRADGPTRLDCDNEDNHRCRFSYCPDCQYLRGSAC
jgi:hypothetical protein